MPPPMALWVLPLDVSQLFHPAWGLGGPQNFLKQRRSGSCLQLASRSPGKQAIHPAGGVFSDGLAPKERLGFCLPLSLPPAEW